MKITDKEILQINKLYKQYKTYAAVAREVGCSAGTVKKYIIPNFDEAAAENVKTFTKEMMPKITNIDHIKDIENICDLCRGLEHLADVKELRKEILI